MPITISNTTGDGIVDTYVDTDIELPDSGTVVTIVGQVTPIGGATVAITGSPLTAPAPPGSGSIYWTITVNTSTGAAQVNQSPSAFPAVPGGQVQVFQQRLDVGASDPALVPTDATPDAIPGA